VHLVFVAPADHPSGTPASFFDHTVQIDASSSSGPSFVAALLDLERALAAEAEAERPTAIFRWTGTSPVSRQVGSHVPVIRDLIDCATFAEWVLFRTVPPKTAFLKIRGILRNFRDERRAVRSADVCLAAGQRDAATLSSISGRKVLLVPNGVTIPTSRNDRARLPTVVFSGTLDFPPNIEALRWFVREIWPLVRERIPEACLTIVGKNAIAEIHHYDGAHGISVHVNVPSMFEYLEQAWCSVAPMRTGSGVKNKVLEAWAASRPVVMTSHAVNGLRLPAGSEALVKDDHREFAAALANLLTQPALLEALGKAAREHVEQHYTWKAVTEPLTEILEQCRLIERP